MRTQFLNLILRLYASGFARKRYFRLNKLLFHLSLRGMGILNFENQAVSGETRFLRAALQGRRTPLVLDVGANRGAYATKVKALSPDARVYAFEPHPLTFRLLQRGARQYGFIVLQMALGNTEGIVTLYDYEKQPGSEHASLFPEAIAGLHKSKTASCSVPATTLDAFLRSEDIDRVDLLKVDTEGSELNVLRGAADALRHNRIDIIQVEFNSMNVFSRVFYHDFLALLPHYRFYRILPDGLVPLPTYEPIHCELFAFQNLVMIRGDMPFSV